MATLAEKRTRFGSDERFFAMSAIIMTMVLVAGFSTQLAYGRSSFAAPLRVHIHALLFFGWTMLYLAQNILVGRGYRTVHRRLGWLAVLWVPAMVIMGTYVTVAMVRAGHAPFFFTPLYFLVMNPLSVLFFAALVAAAIVMRRQTQWHRRLMFCGMTVLLGPGVGRLIPLPLLIPYAGWAVFAVLILFPLAGMVRDLRRDRRIHPAWWWGAGSILVMQVAMDLITFSPIGAALYAAVTADTAGADVPPLAYPPFPGTGGPPQITGRP